MRKYRGIKPSQNEGRPEPAVAPPKIQDSAELLTDPHRGQIFSGYFERIKERIHQTIQRKYSQGAFGEGSVSLIFVLRSDGNLESTVVIKKQTDADTVAQNFALDCLKESAPFGPFPEELGLQKISFNVTVLFDHL